MKYKLIVQVKEEVGRETPFLNRQFQITAWELTHSQRNHMRKQGQRSKEWVKMSQRKEEA